MPACRCLAFGLPLLLVLPRLILRLSQYGFAASPLCFSWTALVHCLPLLLPITLWQPGVLDPPRVALQASYHTRPGLSKRHATRPGLLCNIQLRGTCKALLGGPMVNSQLCSCLGVSGCSTTWPFSCFFSLQSFWFYTHWQQHSNNQHSASTVPRLHQHTQRAGPCASHTPLTHSLTRSDLTHLGM